MTDDETRHSPRCDRDLDVAAKPDRRIHVGHRARLTERRTVVFMVTGAGASAREGEVCSLLAFARA